MKESLPQKNSPKNLVNFRSYFCLSNFVATIYLSDVFSFGYGKEERVAVNIRDQFRSKKKIRIDIIFDCVARSGRYSILN